MGSPTLVLTISADGEFASFVRHELRERDDLRLRAFETVEEALDRTSRSFPGLVVLHLTETVTDGEVARLLAKASLARSGVPVMAVADVYDERRALRLFQLGVTDYLSLADHRDRFASIVEALAVREPVLAPTSTSRPTAAGWVARWMAKRWKVSSPAW